MSKLRFTLVAVIATAWSCGGHQTKGPAAPTPHKTAAAKTTAAKTKTPATKAAADPYAQYAQLDIGSDYKSYTRVNRDRFLSRTHGGRFVDVWVNDVGLKAYESGAPMPVGSVVVKSSWQGKNGKPSDVAGPLFVMQKRKPGFAPKHGDWWYAIYWRDVPPNWVSKVGGKHIYWRSPSKKVAYCWGCHTSYDRDLGMPPKSERAWLDKYPHN